jgi:hypothetical protein
MMAPDAARCILSGRPSRTTAGGGSGAFLRSHLQSVSACPRGSALTTKRPSCISPWLCSLVIYLVPLSKTVPHTGSAASLVGKASRRHRHNSRVGREFLPGQLGMGAHDGGIPPSLGFLCSRQSGLAKELFSTAKARARRGHEQLDLHPWSKLNGELALQERGEPNKASRVRVGPGPPVLGSRSRHTTGSDVRNTGISTYGSRGPREIQLPA